VSRPRRCPAWGAAGSSESYYPPRGPLLSTVDYISAHGTSTNQNDRNEATAIKDVFGDHKVMISSQKSMVGHAIGAAGGIEFVTTVLTVARDLVTPTLNFENPDPGFEHLDFVPGLGREAIH